jgi:WD40 repeat protein
MMTGPLGTAFSVDGAYLASIGRDMSSKLYDVKTQRFIDNITSITPGALKGGLQALTRNPTKDEILIGGSDGVPRIYRMQRVTTRVIGDDANLIRKFPATRGRIFDAAYAPDGKRIATVSSLDRKGQLAIFSAEFDGTMPDDIKSIVQKVAGR